MHDRGISILEKYDLEASAASRGRGALICQTGQGLVLIREYYGSTRKLEYQAKLLEKISGQKEIHVDTLKRNKEENYITVDKENIPYLVKNWYDGKECDTQSRKDIMRSVKALASLHKTMQMPVWEHYVRESLLSEYERHNRELRKIKKFIFQKHQKNEFERCYLEHADRYLCCAEEAFKRISQSSYDRLRTVSLERGCVCHGAFHQHNILMWDSETAVVNFDNWNYDVQWKSGRLPTMHSVRLGSAYSRRLRSCASSLSQITILSMVQPSDFLPAAQLTPSADTSSESVTAQLSESTSDSMRNVPDFGFVMTRPRCSASFMAL